MRPKRVSEYTAGYSQVVFFVFFNHDMIAIEVKPKQGVELLEMG